MSAITLGFDEYRGTQEDEVPLAEIVARRYGANHQTAPITRGDFEGSVGKILEAMDQPSIDGVNTWLVAGAAARSGMKVALSGLGGDELFAGYPSFRDVPRLARWLRPARFVRPLGRALRALVSPFLGRLISPKYAGLLEYAGSFSGAYLLRRALFMPWEAREVLDPATVRTGLERLDTLGRLHASVAGLCGARCKVAALETQWYMRNQLLRDADWAGMAHSVEIRVPFVDVPLFRALAPWLASGYAPSKADAMRILHTPLPEEIAQRPKTGFSTPVAAWTANAGPESMSRGLRAWAQRILSQPTLQRFHAE